MVVSIIIPVYNVAKYLPCGLDSVLNQTYKDLDIVCIDDGSTDGSSEILKEYASKDTRVKIIQQKNCGTFIARQKAIAAASGDYVLFFDPDDWLEPDCVEKVVEYLSINNTDILQYDMIIETEDKQDPNLIWVDKYFNTEIQSLSGPDTMMIECYEKQRIPWNLIGKVVSASVAKKAYEAQEPVEFSTFTDYIAMFYIYHFSNKLEHLQKKIYHYRFGTGVSTITNCRYFPKTYRARCTYF